MTASRAAINRILFGTIDPTVSMDGKPMPAMTTLLYQVCDNDERKFEEATRILELFIEKAINEHGSAP